MISNDIQNIMAQVFGLDKLDIGNHDVKSQIKEPVSDFIIHALWVIGIAGYFESSIYIAGIRARAVDWLKLPAMNRGLLLIPKVYREEYQDLSEFIGSMPLKPVDLPWDDPISSALKSVNLFPDDKWRKGNSTTDFALLAYTDTVLFNSSVYFVPEKDDPINWKLWEAILETVQLLAKAYDDPEINDSLVEFRDPFDRM